MADFAKQAHMALAIYLSRGQQALFLLEKNEFAEAAKFLRLHKAAFHNFRVADALSRQADPEAGGGQLAYQELAQAAIALDDKLLAALGRKKAEAELAVVSLGSQRAKIHKFRSADPPGASFQKSV